MEASTPPVDPSKETPPTEEEKKQTEAESTGQKYDGGEIPRSTSSEENKKG